MLSSTEEQGRKLIVLLLKFSMLLFPLIVLPHLIAKFPGVLATTVQPSLIRDIYERSAVSGLSQKPQIDYTKSPQQDRKQIRYSQQQIADLSREQNRYPLYAPILQKPPNLRAPNGNSQSIWGKIPQTNQIRISRKLKPNSYFEDVDISVAKPIIGDSKPILHYTKLPYTTKTYKITGPQYSSEKPENLIRLISDIEAHNSQNKAQASLEHGKNYISRLADINALQAQLDLASKNHAEHVLKEAHKAALAHVKAQHFALEQAQKDAQKAAMAQFRQSPIILVPQSTFVHPLSLPLKSEVVYNDTPSSTVTTYVAQEEEVMKEPPHKDMEKVSVIQKHVLTQGHHTPNAYQKVVMETQHQREKMVAPKTATILNASEMNANNKHPYASRYAFGYRIKDLKMGNDFGHEEKRDGKSASGHYFVLLPDGRRQKVEYYADPSGYHAKVTYENAIMTMNHK